MPYIVFSVTYQCLPCTVTGAFKNRHHLFVLISDGDMIQPGAFSIVQFFCFGR
jgi:hypothetical protein